jgi:hypothetical protein
MFPGTRSLEERMFDLLYVALSVGFFAAMLWYIRACASLGSSTEESKDGR